jgi:hypothetical protein
MRYVSFIGITGMLLLLIAACKARSPSPSATAEQLQASFQKTDSATTQAVVQASVALQENRFTEAILIMDRVVQSQPINQEQKKAVDALIVQTRRAIQQNPKLDSPELYKAISDLMTRVHGEP